MFPCYSASCSSALNPLPASRFLVPVPASRHSYFCLARPSVSYFPLPASHPRLPPFLFPLGSALLPASRPLLCSSFLASSLSPACSLPSHISLLSHHSSNPCHPFISSKRISLAYRPSTNDHVAPNSVPNHKSIPLLRHAANLDLML